MNKAVVSILVTIISAVILAAGGMLIKHEVELSGQEAANNTMLEAITNLNNKNITLRSEISYKNSATHARIDTLLSVVLRSNKEVAEALKGVEKEVKYQGVKVNLILESSKDVDHIKQTLKAVFGEDVSDNSE